MREPSTRGGPDSSTIAITAVAVCTVVSIPNIPVESTPEATCHRKPPTPIAVSTSSSHTAQRARRRVASRSSTIIRAMTPTLAATVPATPMPATVSFQACAAITAISRTDAP